VGARGLGLPALLIRIQSDPTGDPAGHQRGDEGLARDGARSAASDQLGDWRLALGSDQPNQQGVRSEHGDGRSHTAPSPVNELTNGAAGETQRSCDLRVATTLQLPEDQRSALTVGEVADRLDGLLERLPTLLALGWLLHPGHPGLVQGKILGRASKLLQGGIDGDLVQPGLEPLGSPVPPQGLMRVEQGLLDRIFGLWPRKDPGTSADQFRPVAADQVLECGVKPVRREPGKPIVGLEPKKRRA
jgi:hypothetical protein